MDPYAKAIAGEIQWAPAVFPYPLGGDDLERDDRDSAPYVPRSIVVDDTFDWQGDRPLRRGLHETVIYEVHVKGFTKRHPGIPEHLRGTYAGLAHPESIEYLKSLGVTAVELLPIHQFVHEIHQIAKGAAQLLGLSLVRVLRPARRVFVWGRHRRPGPRIQGDGEAAPRRRSRGDLLVRLGPWGRGTARVHAPPHSPPGRASVPAPGLVHGAAAPRQRRQRHRVVRPRRRRDVRGRLAAAAREGVRRVSQRRCAARRR